MDPPNKQINVDVIFGNPSKHQEKGTLTKHTDPCFGMYLRLPQYDVPWPSEADTHQVLPTPSESGYSSGLWGMTTSVIQQKGLPKDYFLHSQNWGETP